MRYKRLIWAFLIGAQGFLIAGDQEVIVENVEALINGADVQGEATLLEQAIGREVDLLYAGCPGDRNIVQQLLLLEVEKNPSILVPLSSVRGCKREAEHGPTIIGRMLARIIENLHASRASAQNDLDKTRLELHKEKAKSFWSIITAVGSTVLAVASTLWGALEATDAGKVVVSVLCNCTTS